MNYKQNGNSDLVIDPEGLPELPAHLLLVLLDQELGRQLHELGELQRPRAVLIDLKTMPVNMSLGKIH